MSPDERRADLIDVTLRLLRVHGRDVTTRQIAEAAGSPRARSSGPSRPRRSCSTRRSPGPSSPVTWSPGSRRSTRTCRCATGWSTLVVDPPAAVPRHLRADAEDGPGPPARPPARLRGRRGLARAPRRRCSATSSAPTPTSSPCPSTTSSTCSGCSPSPAATSTSPTAAAHPRRDRRHRPATDSRGETDAAPPAARPSSRRTSAWLGGRRRCSSSSACSRCSTCPASTPTSSTTASPPATPTTSCAPAR